VQAKEIGKQIRVRRKRLKVLQRDLAEISSVSPRTVKAVEKGKANPTLEILTRILEPLGLKLTTTERISHE
jgi:transcriptional regulator with XRE-family HTH domain